MPNNIAFAQNYTSILDEVYQRASVSGVLNSGRRVIRAGRNAKEILVPKISVTGLGDYVRNAGYKTGSIAFENESKTSATNESFACSQPPPLHHADLEGVCWATTANRTQR